MNMTTAKVENRKGEFLVSEYDDLYFGVEESQVEQITRKAPYAGEREVAILLATITEARIIPTWKKNTYKEVEHADDAIVKLLQRYDIDNLNDIFEDLRYHEIKSVLESDDPVAALNNVC
ncbi:MAG: hypothetical protein HFJ41_01505 [Clostridia bacterium]|nr:hypothetical protein [Clostridia bacterium]